jgi:hypothetical protein
MNSGMTIFDWVDVEWFTRQYDFDFHYADATAGLRTALHQWAKVWGKLPLVGLTDTIAVYTWFTVLAGGWLIHKKRWPELLVVLAMGVMILTCIASPVNGAFRYYCRALGISWRALDRYLFQELGYHGEEFVQKLKKLE